MKKSFAIENGGKKRAGRRIFEMFSSESCKWGKSSLGIVYKENSVIGELLEFRRHFRQKHKTKKKKLVGVSCNLIQILCQNEMES